ncbi:MAG: alpha/beta hydrolase [Zetaproteobacteria bacterium]|nr:MAG: alpha/beta hydrolase [Zetaproteobacteria bacterium]
MQDFQTHGTKFAYHAKNWASCDIMSLKNIREQSDDTDKPIIIWAHGWGHSHKNWTALITPLEQQARHISLDLPGFGQSPPPPNHWGTEHYADAIATWIKDNDLPPVLWIGHSFGCRVGLQIAARHPECIKAMSLISGAGLKRKRPPHKKMYFYLRIKLFKILRKLIPEGTFKEKLMAKFGSADYKDAGAMRKVFLRVINEDLTTQAQSIQCPVTLIYGENDMETPAEFGVRLAKLIKKSNLFILKDQDHYSVLQNGRHQVIKLLSDFIKENR